MTADVRQYRKRPVVIDAVLFTAETATDVALWCGGRVAGEAKASDPSDIAFTIAIPTLEGTMTGRVGDYIIRGVNGEFYPCRGTIFEQTYEPVE